MKVFDYVRIFFKMPWMTGSHYSSVIQEIAKIILSHDDWSISSNIGCYSLLENEKFSIKFWDSLKYFSYMHEGEITNKSTGHNYKWHSLRPHIYTMVKVDEHLERIIGKDFLKVAVNEKSQEKPKPKQETKEKSGRMIRPILPKKIIWRW